MHIECGNKLTQFPRSHAVLIKFITTTTMIRNKIKSTILSF